MAAPLVGLSVTIWYYLQNISAYLSVPMAAAIFIGLLWKRGTTKGALAGVGIGFASGIVCFLDQTLSWHLPFLASPYLNSFLHRALLVWIITVAAMVVTSELTHPPDQERIKDYVFGRIGRFQWQNLLGYQGMAVLLFLCTGLLWWLFR